MPFDNLPELKPALRPEQRVLLDAARLLGECGWWQGWFEGPEGRVCATEAIARSAATDTLYCAAIDRLAKHLGVNLIAPWNDTPGRTAAEVIAAMRAAGEG